MPPLALAAKATVCCPQKAYDHRSLVPLLAFAVPRPVGQIGLYGPVTKRLKPSDLAPDIRFAKVLDLMPFNAALIF